MFEKILSKGAKESLAILGKSKILGSAYLAGGTALALQIGHRFSFDFDFFTREEFDEKILVQRIKKEIPEFQLEKLEWKTILGYIKETRFSLFFYDYPVISPPRKFLKINIASIKDIAAMKIAAISARGRKRDFIDLYFILKTKNLTLKETLNLYDRKFKVLKQNKIHILKSLSFFEDAKEDKSPKMIKEMKWQKIKNFFEKETKKLSAALLEK